MFNLLKAEFLFFQALACAKKGRFDKSIRIFESVIDSRLSHPGMRLQFGVTLFRNSEYDRALEQLARTRETDRENPAIPMFYGIVLLEVGRDEEALEALDASLALNPDNELCLSLKGITLLRLGRIPEGAEILEKNFFYGNDCLDYFILLFLEGFCAERDVDSLVIFEKSMEDGSDHDNPGMLQSLLSRLDSALDVMDYRFQLIKNKLSSSGSEDGEAFLRGMLSGLRHYAGDRVEEAKAAFRKCAEMDYIPGPRKKHELCACLYHVEEFECLESLLEKYYANDPEAPPEIRFLKIRTSVHLKRYEEAARLLEEYEKAHSPDAWTEYLKGVCRMRTGAVEEAAAFFKNVVAGSSHNMNKSYLAGCLRKTGINRGDDNPR